MKKTILILLIAMTAVAAKAQATFTRNDISYISEHHVLSKAGNVNVVDLDFEWPDKIEFDKAEMLQKSLCDSLFYRYSGNYADSKQAYLNSLGQPIQKLDTIPDDHRFSYYTLVLKEMGLVAGRFVTFFGHISCNAGSKSGIKNFDNEFITVYDINNKMILDERDLLNLDLYLSREESDLNELFYTVTRNQGVLAAVMGPIPVTQECIGFKTFFEDGASRIVYMKSQYVTHKRKVFKRLLESKLNSPNNIAADVVDEEPELVQTNGVWNVDTMHIYNKVDEAAAFNMNDMSAAQYLAAHLELPEGIEVESPKKRMILKFVVERDGTLSNFHVIQQSSPMVDRFVVEALKAMPAWQPATLKGQKVRSWCMFPVSIQY